MTTRILHEVVFPENADIDVAPLYWDVDQASFAAPRVDVDGDDGPAHTAVGTINLDHLLDRRRAVVPAGSRASTATYFNAFPASYWRRWTRIRDVVLTVSATGLGGRVSVYRSTPDGRLQRVQTARFPNAAVDGPAELEFRLPLDAFGDGGWYWFDLIAGHDDLTLQTARYAADVPDDTPDGTATITITTFNRPTWCLALLDELASAAEEIPQIDVVQVVDQGTLKVADMPGFEATADRLGDRLTVIDQPNLGGSGGFARGMHQTATDGRSTYVLLLDDDVAVERESIRRALTFADLCRVPTIVGGHMISAYARASLHSLGEVINRSSFRWGPAPHVREDHDFGVRSLRATPWLHRRIDVDYNAWWMCLIPMDVIKTIGLALPAFIKWDDAEYGLRAGAAGFPTVSLPGVAVWHVPWSGKDDTLDWQAYYHQRNRFVAALLHSPHERGGRVVHESFAHQVKHVLSMQYSAAELRLRALEDVLSGPTHLHASLPTQLAKIRDIRTRYDDARIEPDLEAFPQPAPQRSLRRALGARKPRGKPEVLASAASAAVRQFRRPSPGAADVPEAQVPALDAGWWRLARLDSAVVSMRDGAGFAWYRRDPQLAQDIMRRSVDLHARVLREWPDLQARYREAMSEVTSTAAWAATFDAEGLGDGH